ncbi:MAG: ATP-dependent DNA helicase, partial [Planctomycetota bacterium]|nr:ATP-dependent DNA helicase [Planctomycetota bacterium]
VNSRLRATRRARMAAITSGGAIPDTADYKVILDPEGILVGTLNEDFAIESNVGDIFQLGNTSWRILRVERGTVRVADAKGQPPTLPFWLGEARARTEELSDGVGEVREKGADVSWLVREAGISDEVARSVAEYVKAGAKALGAVPTQRCVVIERFFDESGGQQLVVHSPFGGRINRAWGLALRKRFCRRFGFELQAAANEEAIVISLSEQHSFPLEEVFDYVHPDVARDLLVQAMLPTPMFITRWRWNVSRALLVERMQGGKRVPAPLLRMRAEDRLAEAFPDVIACGETLDPGNISVPEDHPLVGQTVVDCLTDAMDIDGLVEVLRGLKDGRIRKVAVDTPEPSPYSLGILSAKPYAFLDDAPLEERRTQAVITRRALDPRSADGLGALYPKAVRRVREEAWPDPTDEEEVHEALLWMGYVTEEEAAPWRTWLDELARGGRVVKEGNQWFAAEATRDPKEVLRGRLEALGPVFGDDPLYRVLESEGAILRVRLDGRSGWCERRLLGRITRYTVERLRKEIEPVTPSEFLRFLACWQRVDEEYRLEGPAGVADVVGQLAGFEAPTRAWEKHILKQRVKGYRPDWLDQLCLRGEVVWGRLWGSGSPAIRSTPICLLPRGDARSWQGLAGPPRREDLSWPARTLQEFLAARGAMFPQDLAHAAEMLPSHLDDGLGELVSRGLATSDSFGSLRKLLLPASRRKRLRKPVTAAGRWSLFRSEPPSPQPSAAASAPEAEFVAGVLLRRYGVVFRRILTRERQPIPWREIVRSLRVMELRGDVRGGRFVASFSGEQFALPEAVERLRSIRRGGERPVVIVSSADPLNLQGILTPDERISSGTLRTVPVI